MYGVVAYLKNGIWSARFNELENALGVLKEVAESCNGCVIDMTTCEIIYSTGED